MGENNPSFHNSYVKYQLFITSWSLNIYYFVIYSRPVEVFVPIPAVL